MSYTHLQVSNDKCLQAGICVKQLFYMQMIPAWRGLTDMYTRLKQQRSYRHFYNIVDVRHPLYICAIK
jgi:hypothetical protein